MSLTSWWKGKFAKEQTASALYKSGILHARKRKNQAAIDSYTAAIQFPGVNEELKSMALYNRALVLHAELEHERAVDDLDQVLKMHGAHGDVKKAAGIKLSKIKKRMGRQ